MWNEDGWTASDDHHSTLERVMAQKPGEAVRQPERKMNTKESREYWRAVEKIAKQVKRWPKWKRQLGS